MNMENSENKINQKQMDNDLNSNLLKKESEIIIKEEIKQAYFSATDKLKEWIKIYRNFQSVKDSLNSYKNMMLEFIFDQIGYKYNGHIVHPNFLHLSAEAWLLGVFQELEKEINGNLLNITFNDLINLISQIIVKENVFIENMVVLIGKFSYLESFANEDRIFRSMLIDMNSTKIEILKDEKILKNYELSNEKFTQIMEKILRTAFNIFLNNINSDEEFKKSTLLYTCFDNLKKQHNLSFEEFQKSYATAKKMNEIISDNLRHQLLGYYEFSLSSFDDLLLELQDFNKNSSSIIFKIFSILPKNLLTEFFHNKLDFLKALEFNFSLRNLRLQHIRKFLEHCYVNSKYCLTEAYSGLDYKAKKVKSWVNSMEVVKSVSNISYELYKNSRDNFGEYFLTGFRKFNFFYTPLKYITLEIKDKGKSFVITVLNSSVQFAVFLQRIVFGFIARNFQILKNYLIGKEPLFKVSSEDEDFYSIEINKKLFLINPELFFDFFSAIGGFLGKIYNLKFIAEDFTRINNKKVLEGGISENVPKQSMELSAQRYEKHKEL